MTINVWFNATTGSSLRVRRRRTQRFIVQPKPRQILPQPIRVIRRATFGSRDGKQFAACIRERSRAPADFDHVGPLHAVTDRGPGLLAEVFDRVIDDDKLYRNFARSGIAGQKSLGSLRKQFVLPWFESRSDEQLFWAAVGNDPLLTDVIRMVHPKPRTASRAALYGYLIRQSHAAVDLPDLVKAFEACKTAESMALPDVPSKQPRVGGGVIGAMLAIFASKTRCGRVPRMSRMTPVVV